VIATIDERKLALVSGGSGGIGSAICTALAREGFDVALTYRKNRDAAEATADAVRALGHTASTHQLELTSVPAVREMVRSLPRIHSVVSAAGPQIPMRYTGAIEPEVFAEQLLQDAAAVFNLLHPAIEALRQTQGTVVCLTTTALTRYATRDLLSAAPKGAVEQIARAIAAEEGRFGVRVNCVGVGTIEAGLWDDLLESGDYDERALAAARRAIPLRRFGSADELAEAVAFLAGPRSSYITGQTLNVDGGYSV
jgi:NAD(P)-dependent dehydrogenase (short-subunit alcohol dehydrogenase family)